MSILSGFARRPVVRRGLPALLALCVTVLVASPLLPHDAACHLKARTDCTACTLHVASGDVRAHGAPGVPLLTQAAGPVLPPDDRLPSGLIRTSNADRAPPA